MVDDSLICHDGLKAKWSLATLDAQYKVQQRIPEIQLPFITLHGSRDKIVDIASSYFLMDHAKSEDKVMKVFEVVLIDNVHLSVCRYLKAVVTHCFMTVTKRKPHK